MIATSMTVVAVDVADVVCVVETVLVIVEVSELVSVVVRVLVAVVVCVDDLQASHIAGHASSTRMILDPERIFVPHLPAIFLHPWSSNWPKHRGAVVAVEVWVVVIVLGLVVVGVLEAVVVKVVVFVEHESQSPGHKSVKFISLPRNLKRSPQASSPTSLQSASSPPPSSQPNVVVTVDVTEVVAVDDFVEVPVDDAVVVSVVEPVVVTDVVAVVVSVDKAVVNNDEVAVEVPLVEADVVCVDVTLVVSVVVAVAMHASHPAGQSREILLPKNVPSHPLFKRTAHRSVSFRPKHAGAVVIVVVGVDVAVLVAVVHLTHSSAPFVPCLQ